MKHESEHLQKHAGQNNMTPIWEYAKKCALYNKGRTLEGPTTEIQEKWTQRAELKSHAKPAQTQPGIVHIAETQRGNSEPEYQKNYNA